MTKKDFELLKEGELITIHNKHNEIVDIFHYSPVVQELRHHNYNGEDYYYLSIVLCPRLEQISKTTKSDIDEYYSRKKSIFDRQLEKIINLKTELK